MTISVRSSIARLPGARRTRTAASPTTRSSARSSRAMADSCSRAGAARPTARRASRRRRRRRSACCPTRSSVRARRRSPAWCAAPRRSTRRCGRVHTEAAVTSAFRYRDGHLYCDDVAAEIAERYRAFDQAFAPLDRLIAYSVKANGNLSVLRLLRGLGAGADIVSAGELYRARLAGIPAEKIVFSGVGKTVPELA